MDLTKDIKLLYYSIIYRTYINKNSGIPEFLFFTTNIFFEDFFFLKNHLF